MLKCIVLYCNVLYCIVMYWIELNWTVLYRNVLYWIVFYSIVMYSIVLYWIVFYSIVMYCIVLNCFWVDLISFHKTVTIIIRINEDTLDYYSSHYEIPSSLSLCDMRIDFIVIYESSWGGNLHRTKSHLHMEYSK